MTCVVLASHGEAARELDAAQVAPGIGPALEVIERECEMLVAGAADMRWALCGKQPPVHKRWRQPCRCSSRATGATLEVRSPYTAPEAGVTLRTYAAGVVHLTSSLTEAYTSLTDMEAAMSTRSVIDQAIGIVMAQQRCSDRTAFRGGSL